MKSLTYFWLFLPVLSTLSLPQDVTRCSANTNFRRFFSKFNVQAPAVVVLGGYLPIGENQGVNSTWYCAGQHPTASGVHGIFLSHIRGGHGFEIGISQEPFDPSGYQLYLHKATNGNTNATARLRICQFPSIKTLGPTANNDVTTGRNCLFNKAIPAHMSEHSVVGITWDNDRVTVFSDKIYYFYFKNDWSRVATKCYNSGGCAMQYVYEPTYYMLNVTSAGEDGISYQPCTANCIGYAANVFATEPNGHIPEGFSFNNWFLLSNDSTLVHGKVVSNQPLLVNCLLAIPKIYGLGQFFSFNQTIDGVCNGAAVQRAPEALRFNINDTSVILAEGSIVLHTALGTNFSFVCSSSSDPHLATFAIPLGAIQVPYYCFLKVDTYNSTVYKFLAVLPPTVREIVITKYGDVYVNGFGYLHLGLLDAVTVNFTGHGTDDDVSGFWTIASTNFVDALIEVQGTAIQRILYCDDPVSQLKCSQVSFDLDDGFYPISSTNLLSYEQPTSFVTLPSFNDHSFVNITVSAAFGGHSGANLIASDTTINGFSSFCVDTRQFTISLFYNVTNSYGYVSKSQDSNCPFTLQSVNDYLSFSKFCVSTSLLASACTIDLFGYPEFGSGVKFTSLYFQFTKGELITGTPKPLEGVTDVSFMTLDVCTKYTIYGFKGEGIITLTNSSFLAGFYYTSDSGQLLAFKNVTSGAVYSVTPCSFSEQAAYVDDDIVGVISSLSSSTFNSTRELPGFFYHSNDGSNCTEPVLVYSNIGVCKSGSIGYVPSQSGQVKIAPTVTGNISIPTNFSMSIRTEYLQLYNTPVSVDCATYVCNGNSRCKQLLTQYTAACKTIESALQLSARLESAEVNSMLTISEEALQLATISSFNGDGYNFTNVLGVSVYDPASGRVVQKRSFIEDLLFNKVVTNGLGTVDEDYKRCSNGRSVADLVCAQYYSGVMVLPGVVDAEKLHMYSASLIGGMVLGGFTAAAALPFSYAVQARLNYLALQTDVLQRNQQLLAESFNSAIGNITSAFESVKEAISQTSKGLNTVAHALTKVQEVVNSQGAALTQLTVQLQHNFQAISSSIDDIYSRLDILSADVQVDRLITGRLSALNAFVAQTLTKYTEVQASRKLAQQKVNECVKSQSQRYGFCGGDGEHIFSLVQAAPQGLLFLHTVLVPGDFVNVIAIAGLCVNDEIALTLREPGLVLFTHELQNTATEYFVSSRRMYEPRKPTVGDFVQIESCVVTYVNLTRDQLPDVIPDYIDVNKTLDEILASLPNRTGPSLSLDVFNATYLNLTGEIADLEQRSESLRNTTEELQSLIYNINNTLVDLEWLNRVETYIKWPWWVWLIIFIVLIFVVSLLVFCCISTGCCGCCGCCGACFSGCCRGPRLQPYEAFEKVHVQ
uniref:Spike glycoprotein n=1 Tax=Porcine epidemic diarrhea virus TaxID=28295 RepID=A0A0P0TDF0_PEDV|nr:spike protein [Porcine epidemic diarrhea virus]AKA64498.1 spike protein [Porcine epidemic diarrhea virus]AKA64499.1 spike protein [Porcine epidemic diarrhea virus]ALM09364.1 spike protein [Porcine epidemic diarrhea virus]